VRRELNAIGRRFERKNYGIEKLEKNLQRLLVGTKISG